MRNSIKVGDRFGRWEVIADAPSRRQHSYVLCRCTCGTEREVEPSQLKRGHSQSCGCLKKELCKERFFKHGQIDSSEYGTWKAMRRRCENPKAKQHKDYGGRGIKVCDRWQKFENFFADMGSRPTPESTLERIDNDGHYEPGNCRWDSRHRQQRNQRANVLLTCEGKTQCLMDWANEKGLSHSILRCRILRGWPVDKALNTPALTKFSPRKNID